MKSDGMVTTFAGRNVDEMARDELVKAMKVLAGLQPDLAGFSTMVPMILHCPECRARHVDEGEFALKEHHTHACQSCGFVWRPAVVPTLGVRFLPGFKNPEPPAPEIYITKGERALWRMGGQLHNRDCPLPLGKGSCDCMYDPICTDSLREPYTREHQAHLLRGRS